MAFVVKGMTGAGIWKSQKTKYKIDEDSRV